MLARRRQMGDEAEAGVATRALMMHGVLSTAGADRGQFLHHATEADDPDRTHAHQREMQFPRIT